MCHCGNTKRGSVFALSLQGIVHMEISQVSRNDRFAAQIDLETGRYPPIVRLLSCLVSFHFSFRFEGRQVAMVTGLKIVRFGKSERKSSSLRVMSPPFCMAYAPIMMSAIGRLATCPARLRVICSYHAL